MKPDYILIVGQGRSGTNWLLDLLDLSSETHCRNEGDQLATSPLAQLPSPKVRKPLGDRFGQQWGERFGEVEAMTVDESELWYWCYASETIHSVGEGRSNYVRVIYEDLSTDSLEITKHLYQKCHLPWTKEIEAEVAKSASRANKIATAWYKKLEPE
ncbi:hypothetical protein [Coleofasciculus sp. F4-SAH-05]|uniref:hypothetical protein n=1 Tax=Coleofasciculus sp. F4-SAH-05 TaxID=3069525 RepID=UPI0032FED2A1